MPEKFYAEDHVWLEMRQDGLASVGLAAWPAGLSEVELPAPGRNVAKGEACVTLTGATTLTLRAPLSGTIAEPNAALTRDPAALNAETWLFTMRLADPTAFTTLLDHDVALAAQAK